MEFHNTRAVSRERGREWEGDEGERKRRRDEGKKERGMEGQRRWGGRESVGERETERDRGKAMLRQKAWLQSRVSLFAKSRQGSWVAAVGWSVIYRFPLAVRCLTGSWDRAPDQPWHVSIHFPNSTGL